MTDTPPPAEQLPTYPILEAMRAALLEDYARQVRALDADFDADYPDGEDVDTSELPGYDECRADLNEKLADLAMRMADELVPYQPPAELTPPKVLEFALYKEATDTLRAFVEVDRFTFMTWLDQQYPGTTLEQVTAAMVEEYETESPGGTGDIPYEWYACGDSGAPRLDEIRELDRAS